MVFINQTTTTVGATGAALGDVVAVGGVLDGSLVITAAVTASDVVTLYAYNPTAAPITINNRTFRVIVFKGSTHAY